MAEKPPSKKSRQGYDSKGDDIKNQRAEVHYIKGVEQLDRWRAEFLQHKEMELRLASLSKLSYDPVDYSVLLERTPFKEKPLTDCSYLIEEARKRTENRYMVPILSRVGVLVFLLVVLIIFFSAMILWITGALATAAGAALFLAIKERRYEMYRALAEAQAEIDWRRENEIRINEEARLQHEDKEDQRITAAENMLNGDIGAVMARIDEVLPHLKFPFPLVLDIDVFNNIPMVKVWLPAKTVIPRNTVELLASGRIQYQEKDFLAHNKQYLEMVCSVVMHVLSALYANIPSFDRGYVMGFIKEETDDTCVLAVAFDRQSIINACSTLNGLAAIQSLSGTFECDTMLGVRAIEPIWPEEWKEVEQKMLRSLHIKINRY